MAWRALCSRSTWTSPAYPRRGSTADRIPRGGHGQGRLRATGLPRLKTSLEYCNVTTYNVTYKSTRGDKVTMTARASGKLDSLLARNRLYIPGGVSSINRIIDPPIVFTKGGGAYVWDIDGKRY